MFNTPIVFIIYNRPETTQKVFDVIRKIKPKQLFVIADGAKNEDDLKNVIETRRIIENIDWDCKLYTFFSEINIGISLNIINGLSKVFHQVDKAIILEDDCLPSLSFFKFCEEVLNIYEHDQNIMHISGFNILSSCDVNSSYFFSKFILPPWGWATWKRAWRLNNPNFDSWQQIKTWAYKNISQEFFKHWTDMFEYSRITHSHWDTPWNVDLWKNNSLCIVPTKSLIQNIGIGNEASFTKSKNASIAAILANELKFPLVHPIKKELLFDNTIEKVLIKAIKEQC